jgi:hypothetical protein
MSGLFSIHSGVELRWGGESGQGGEENREEIEQAFSDTGILARPSHGRIHFEKDRLCWMSEILRKIEKNEWIKSPGRRCAKFMLKKKEKDRNR